MKLTNTELVNASSGIAEYLSRLNGHRWERAHFCARHAETAALEYTGTISITSELILENIVGHWLPHCYNSPSSSELVVDGSREATIAVHRFSQARTSSRSDI